MKLKYSRINIKESKFTGQTRKKKPYTINFIVYGKKKPDKHSLSYNAYQLSDNPSTRRMVDYIVTAV